MAFIWTYPGRILRIVDGDTVQLALDLGFRLTLTASCRVLGINSPEIGTVLGKAARDFAATLLPVGGDVTFASHSLDKYGRPLGTITYQGIDFAARMIAAGHAVAMKD